MESIKLKKRNWTEEDFNEMGWHDCKIYALAFDDEKFQISFDLDYIFEWVSQQDDSYKFWVAPATLTFRNVHDLNICMNSTSCQIQDIDKSSPSTPKNIGYIKEKIEYDWSIETTDGEITFKSTGYNQYIRDEPRLLDSQFVEAKLRGGISFAII